MILHNGITEELFLSRFPDPYLVRALSPFEADKEKLDSWQDQWRFEQPFRYVSDRFGLVTVPAGMITDFASIPAAVRNIIDDDSPLILFASAPHDWLFGAKGQRAGMPPMSFHDCNLLLVEAMYYCGAPEAIRGIVFEAVQIGGRAHWPNDEVKTP